MSAPSTSDTKAAEVALEHLADALDPQEHVITLVTSPGRVPHLTVASRHAELAESVYADQRCYWWSWAEPICGVDDPPAAARKIAAVLRTDHGPTRG